VVASSIEPGAASSAVDLSNETGSVTLGSLPEGIGLAISALREEAESIRDVRAPRRRVSSPGVSGGLGRGLGGLALAVRHRVRTAAGVARALGALSARERAGLAHRKPGACRWG
jgi:hypothetical protein